MQKANVWSGKQLLTCIAELLLPRAVDPLQVTVEAGDAEQIYGKVKEILKFLKFRKRISCGALSHHDDFCYRLRNSGSLAPPGRDAACCVSTKLSFDLSIRAQYHRQPR